MHPSPTVAAKQLAESLCFHLIGRAARKRRGVKFDCRAETGNRALQHVVKPLAFLAAAEVI